MVNSSNLRKSFIEVVKKELEGVQLTVLKHQGSEVDGVKSRDLVPSLASRDFPLGANGRLYSACVLSTIVVGRGFSTSPPHFMKTLLYCLLFSAI